MGLTKFKPCAPRRWVDPSIYDAISVHRILDVYMGEISQGVQSLNLMSYLSGVLGPFFGDLGLCYGKN